MLYGWDGYCRFGISLSVYHGLGGISSCGLNASEMSTAHTLRPITFACWALPSLLILAWTNMFPAYVHHVSSGYANFDEFDDHWTMSP